MYCIGVPAGSVRNLHVTAFHSSLVSTERTREEFKEISSGPIKVENILQPLQCYIVTYLEYIYVVRCNLCCKATVLEVRPREMKASLSKQRTY